MTKGVILYNRGTKCIVRLIVALHSLRKHYTGPVSIFIEGEQPEGLLPCLAATFGVTIIKDQDENVATLVRKIQISRKSPYDVTVFLDADTVTLGTFDELFEWAEQHDFVVTNFANWRSDGGIISRRIRSFVDIVDKESVELAVKFGPAINTGIYAFDLRRVPAELWDSWFLIAQAGSTAEPKKYIPDEIACQILLPFYDFCIAPTSFNVSVKYDPNTTDKRIAHFHGRKHCGKYDLCRIWLNEYIECLETDVCGIREYTDAKKYGDRTLMHFLKGQRGHLDLIPKAQRFLLLPSAATPPAPVITNPLPNEAFLEPEEKQALEPIVNPVKESTTIPVSDVTIVTACDVKYLDHLRTSLPNWIHMKHVDQYPLVVYINGLLPTDSRLDFIHQHPQVKIIPWEMPQAETQRERMLSAFVLGTAQDITTPFWLKLDADAFMVDDRPLIEGHFKDYVIVGHKWNYTKPGTWVNDLDHWANSRTEFNGTPNLYDPKNLDGRRYYHKRIASYVCLHQTDFMKFVAHLAGERLPVPSHDTFAWYVAARLGLPIGRHNFKKNSGVTNFTQIEKMQTAAAQITA